MTVADEHPVKPFHRLLTCVDDFRTVRPVFARPCSCVVPAARAKSTSANFEVLFENNLINRIPDAAITTLSPDTAVCQEEFSYKVVAHRERNFHSSQYFR